MQGYKVIARMDKFKNANPYDYNLSFYKKFWGLIKEEVCVMFDQFFQNVVLFKSLTSFFVVFIPKVESPLYLGDFGHISLLGSFTS